MFLVVDLHFSFLSVDFTTVVFSSNPRSANAIVRKLLEVIQHDSSIQILQAKAAIPLRSCDSLIGFCRMQH